MPGKKKPALERDRKGSRSRTMIQKSKPFVSWIAILLGVFMVVVGGLILLWGLSFQSQVGEVQDPGGNELTGGPILIPGGVAFLAFGTLWIYHGLKGFRKREEEIGFKNCPNCRKRIEDDLNFCYHCATTFSKEGDKPDVGEDELPEEIIDELDDDGLTRGQKARMKRQEERKRVAEEKRASNLDDLKDSMKGQ